MVKTIFPPNNSETSKKTTIFLAGPIQGAENWQKQATRIFEESSLNIDIANPRRDYIDGEFVYEKQVDWETKFLNKSANNGLILFWLAKEKEHNCKRSYAQTTRFELAEWKVKHEKNRNIKIVLGIEEGFTNKRYIERRFSQDCPEIKICNSLEETCNMAIDILSK